MKLALTFEGEFNLADFSPEEIDQMLGYMDEGLSVEELREKYFEFYDDIKDRTLEKHKWSD
jgi:hypothetical protein